MITPSAAAAPTPPLSPQDQRLMAKARELEAAFLSEMLRYAGLDSAGAGGFGGAGEEQFGSFLRDAQARQLVDRGGIGLAEMLFKSLSRDDHGQS